MWRISPGEAIAGRPSAGDAAGQHARQGGAMGDRSPAGTTDWERLAHRLGTVHAAGENVALDDARNALEEILGPEEIRSAVEWAGSEKPGALLAMSVLRILRVDSACAHCLDLIAAAEHPEDRLVLLRLLGDILNRSCAPRLLGAFEAGDESFKLLMLDLLIEQLRGGSLFPEDVRDLLTRAKAAASPAVRDLAATVAAPWSELR